MATPATNSKEALSSLAKEIREENAAAEKDALSAIAHARRAGELLIEAKASVKHGEWGRWLAENVDFSQQWAASLMRVAKAPPAQIESAVSVRGALKQLAPPTASAVDDGDPMLKAKAQVETAEAEKRVAAAELVKASEAAMADLGVTVTATCLEFREGISLQDWTRVGEVLSTLASTLPLDEGLGSFPPAARWDLEEKMGDLADEAREALAEIRNDG